MKIHLSNSIFLGNIDPFIDGFDASKPGELHITANKSWIFVHPVVLSMVAALGSSLEAKKIVCDPISARSGHYLERMSLFKFLNIESGMDIQEHDPSGRFIPLTRIKTSDELSEFLTNMIPLLHLDPRHAEPIRYTMSELVRNVLEHAQAEDGAIVCAQYHEKSNKIRIGIADRGIGIRRSIGRSYETSDDLEAIQLALTPGVTGATRREGGTAQNAGAGLFFIKSIAYVNRDFFVLYSGSGLYKLLKRRESQRIVLRSDPFLDRHSHRGDVPSWQGTVVGIDISLEQTQEFTKLLDLIRDTYGRAVRERRRERFRKPRFI